MKALSQFRSQVFSTAWKLVKETGISLSEALKNAWAQVKLQALRVSLSIGSVQVTFRKVDGTVTTPLATRNLGLIPSEAAPKVSKPESSALAFYSLTDNGWRSLKTENLICFSIL